MHDPISMRLEEETIEDLSGEYKERGFRNRAVYIRWIIGQRDVLFEDDGGGIDAAERLADHDDRLDDLDNRLGELEEQARPFSWTSRSSDSSP